MPRQRLILGFEGQALLSFSSHQHRPVPWRRQRQQGESERPEPPGIITELRLSAF
jgi:hypothetical protein